MVIVQSSQSWQTIVSLTRDHTIIYHFKEDMLFFAELAETAAAVVIPSLKDCPVLRRRKCSHNVCQTSRRHPECYGEKR